MHTDLAVIDTPSPNFGDRKGMPVNILVLHYTGMESGALALERLRDPAAQVSAHYLIEEDGRIFRLVAEDKRAHHAGESCWRHWRDVNSASIGIEIVNGGHDFGLPPYPEVQMAALEALCLDIMRRQPIPPRNVVGHSDIAPWRKDDPGEHFSWRRLEQAGIAVATPPIDRLEGPGLEWGDESEEVGALQHALASYGYCCPRTCVFDTRTTATLVAFQRRFRPQLVDGAADAQCRAILAALTRFVGV